MKIAVLVSTYNGERFLDLQLKSLAEQTVKECMTVYIRDDGSTDSTFEIIDKWKEKLDIILYKEKNAGPALSFWKLLMNPKIQADYYAFCDQDDIWDSDKLEVAIDKLKDKICFYACNCRIIDENNQIIHKRRVSQPPEISTQRLFVSGCTQGCSMVFTDALRNYLENLNIKCVPMHDIIVMLYAMQFGKIYWDQEPHFSYRVHSNNVVAKGNKSFFENLKTTYWNWKNSSKNSMANVANEMCNNLDNLTQKDIFFLKQISDYKKNRISLIQECTDCGAGYREIRSYRIRILLGLY